MTDASPGRRPRRRRPVSATAPALAEVRDRLHAEVAKVVVGQGAVVDDLVGALLVGGHVLLRGVPGVAKTLLANAFARALDLDFQRVQFTPDLLPSDVTGTVVLRGADLAFRPGPVFTNLLLGDEINRTPPKTQAALLEAMQERQVSVDGTTHPLPDPFLVVATQNPIEFEGTYPLPEAQLDRFHVLVDVDYPDRDAAADMLRLTHHGVDPATLDDVDPVVTAAEIVRLRTLASETRAADEIIGYVIDLVEATRSVPSIEVGVSPRGAVHLLAAAKARARLRGRDFVTPDDVADATQPVLAHRIRLSAEAELDRYSPSDAIEAAVSTVAVPR